jgi:hypothetical protein
MLNEAIFWDGGSNIFAVVKKTQSSAINQQG